MRKNLPVEIVEISSDDFKAIVKDKIPSGKFIAFEGGFIFAVDNTSGEPVLEYFLSEAAARDWLRKGSDANE
jgi:hypothetical protein